MGRIIRLTQEVIDYREWIIKKWGGRDVARTDNRGTINQTLIYSKEEKLLEEYGVEDFILINGK